MRPVPTSEWCTTCIVFILVGGRCCAAGGGCCDPCVPLVTWRAVQPAGLGSSISHRKSTAARRPKRLAQQPPPPLMALLAKRLLHHCWSVRPMRDDWLVTGTWLLFFHILGIIIQFDFHIFQRGWNHQPDDYGWVGFLQRKVLPPFSTCSSGDPTIGQFKTCWLGSQEYLGAPNFETCPVVYFASSNMQHLFSNFVRCGCAMGKAGNANDSTFCWWFLLDVDSGFGHKLQQQPKRNVHSIGAVFKTLLLNDDI